MPAIAPEPSGSSSTSAEHRVEARVIAPQRRGVREEVVRGEDRLRPAHVRVRRHQRIAGLRRALGEHRRSSARRPRCSSRHAALQVQPQIDGDLLVARPAGVQAPPGVADPRRQLALDERVHVLVLRAASASRRRPGRRRARESRRSAAPIAAPSAADITPGALQPLRPREAAPHVVFEQPPIETEGGAEREQRRVGIALEPSGPEMRHGQCPTGAGRPAALRAAVSIGSPQILMKPSVAPRSNRSPAS